MLRIILAQLHNISVLNKPVNKWKKETLGKFSVQIRNKISKIQFPTNCNLTKKLICQVKNSCGFGCQIHHLIYCYVTAYFTNRTLIVNSKGWNYDSNGYDKIFTPFTNCSLNFSDQFEVNYGNENF